VAAGFLGKEDRGEEDRVAQMAMWPPGS
jgi:hypothetical protein